MGDESMTLIERLRNPQWVHGADMNSEAELDKEQTRKDMREAADEIVRLREVLINANNNWRHEFSEEVEAAADKLFKRLAGHRTDPFNRRNAEIQALAE